MPRVDQNKPPKWTTLECQNHRGYFVESARQEVLDDPRLPGIKNAFSELF